MSTSQRCLVTGASGYIGGRLVPELLAAGYGVRCMARDPGKLDGRRWSGDVEVAVADAMDPAAVRRALVGVEVAYYLIHSLGAGPSFERRDRDAAGIFAAAAASAGVKRIVYLGGIVSGPADGLSPHLRSRGEVGDILQSSGVPTAVLQAAVIIGSGSASFEMLRYLTERLPAMVTPKWVSTRIQPIAVQDVLRYLVGSAALPADVSRSFDIGGPDVLTYADMMDRYCAVAGLRQRVLIPVPLLTPRLSSLWVGLVTPVPAGLARPLVESLVNEVVCADRDIAEYVPDPPAGLVPLDLAIALALRHTRSRAGWPGTRTGALSPRSTASCSAGWSAISPAPPSYCPGRVPQADFPRATIMSRTVYQSADVDGVSIFSLLARRDQAAPRRLQPGPAAVRPRPVGRRARLPRPARPARHPDRPVLRLPHQRRQLPGLAGVAARAPAAAAGGVGTPRPVLPDGRGGGLPAGRARRRGPSPRRRALRAGRAARPDRRAHQEVPALTRRRRYSKRTLPGAVIRRSSGSVTAMIAKAMTSPAPIRS